MRNYMNGGCVTIAQDNNIANETKNSQADERLYIDDILNVKDLEDHQPDNSISDSTIETADVDINDRKSDKEINKKVRKLD